ncbi:hypothetical protein GQ53DRAFT_732071 [Thozetella sp. PMI_491]|nr:hypothetical protein GQ53DRAFT_732071 [Thozetella sp. PMI_491]
MGVPTIRATTRPARPLLGWSLFTLCLWLFTCLVKLRRNELTWAPATQSSHIQPGVPGYDSRPSNVDIIQEVVEHFIAHPIEPPYKDQFGEFGGRVQLLREWIQLAERAASEKERESLMATAEQLAASLFPFLKTNRRKATPLQDLRQSFTNPRGIVIPTGVKTFRYACHLVVTLRQVLGSKLPIQIVYAGDEDLPAQRREDIAILSREDPIDFLDILTVFDDSTLQLATGGWAIKAFAALAAPFKEVIVLDADAVFLRDPEVLFEQEGYVDTGALFFHDRLLWQNGFPERHEWWHSQITRPSDALAKSRVWNQQYAEEQDSGVVVVDKSQLDIFMGLLHVAWQNTYAVREEVTFRLTYGDKESWWLGLELAGAPYAFEKHYGGIVGWKKDQTKPGRDDTPGERVCSFVIAHVDDDERLLWYNGGLLKNKLALPTTFEIPTHWAVDGKWEKGARKEDSSCMVGGQQVALTGYETTVLEQAMTLAQQVDSDLNLL